MNCKGIKTQKYFCKNCNLPIHFKSYSSTHQFCNSKCSSEHRKKTNIDAKRKLFYDGKLTSRKYIYMFLKERDTDCCSVCGITSWNGKEIRLWVDHIDGNAANNSPDNFRLICPNCDSQSDTFGAKNTGSGRKSRGLAPYG